VSGGELSTLQDTAINLNKAFPKDPAELTRIPEEARRRPARPGRQPGHHRRNPFRRREHQQQPWRPTLKPSIGWSPRALASSKARQRDAEHRPDHRRVRASSARISHRWGPDHPDLTRSFPHGSVHRTASTATPHPRALGQAGRADPRTSSSRSSGEVAEVTRVRDNLPCMDPTSRANQVIEAMQRWVAQVKFKPGATR